MQVKSGAGVWSLVIVCALLVTARVASAQSAGTNDGFGIERFRLAMDRDALLDVEWAGVPEHGTWGASAWLGFAHDPLVFYRDGAALDPVVDRRLATGLVGSIALYDRIELGLGLDLIGYQSGSETLMSLPSSGLGDVRMIGKLSLYARDGLAIALVPTVTVPGGSANGYLREAGPTAEPAIALSIARPPWRAAINAGYRIRERVETAGLVIDDEMMVRAAAGFTIGPAELSTSFSVAAPPKDLHRNQVAIEALGGGGLAVTPAVQAFAAIGVGLDNGFGTPDWRAVAGVRIARAKPARATAPPVVIVTPPPPVVKPPPAVAAPAILDGKVVDAEGLPIRDVAIAVGTVATTTDEDGVFHATVPAGTLEVDATAAEYQAKSVTITAAAGATVPVRIELARKVRQGQLRGEVLTPDGKLLTGATITVTEAGKPVASTTVNAEGQFSIELPAGTFEVTIELERFLPQKRTVKIKLDGVTVLNVSMRKAP